jgi:hypothetical protein
MEVDREAACLHAFHDGGAHGDLVCIGLGFEGFKKCSAMLVNRALLQHTCRHLAASKVP